MIEICIIHFLGLTSGTWKLYAVLKIHVIVMEISKNVQKWYLFIYFKNIKIVFSLPIILLEKYPEEVLLIFCNSLFSVMFIYNSWVKHKVK